MGRFSERAPGAIRNPVILMKTSNDSGSPTASQQSADGTGGGVSARTGRVRVKICGITNRADALAAVSAGADALGFNTWEGSKRRMDIFSAGEWMKDLPAFVARVADVAEASQHHPDIDIRYTKVHFSLSTHDAGGITQKDFDLARAIEELAAA